MISALRALYGYAIERAHVEFNPADGLVMPRAGEPAPRERAETPTCDVERSARRAAAQNHAAAREASRGLRPAGGPEPRPARTPGAAGRAARGKTAVERRDERERLASEPMRVLPERILSLAMRAVFVLFACRPRVLPRVALSRRAGLAARPRPRADTDRPLRTPSGARPRPGPARAPSREAPAAAAPIGGTLLDPAGLAGAAGDHGGLHRCPACSRG